LGEEEGVEGALCCKNNLQWWKYVEEEEEGW
jgi:hypothetical protein